MSFVPDTRPEVLEWARKVIGLRREDAAAALDIDRLTLQLWEEGFEGPTFNELRRMAEVYKKPLATLLRSDLPKNEKPIEGDWRLLKVNQHREWSSDLWLALWRVQFQHDVADELATLEDNIPAPLDLSLSLDEPTDIAARRARAWLEDSAPRTVNIFGKRDFSQWVSLIESRGILVTQISDVPLQEMRGFSISEQPFPVIALNSYDSHNGRIFTLMHELVHILLHASGLCDLEDKVLVVQDERERVERFCNQVAAAILMPRDRILALPRIASATTLTIWHEADVAEMALRFGVSREAAAIRLITAMSAPWRLYSDLKPRFERAYEEDRPAPRGSGFYPPNNRRVRDFGRRYTGSVLSAYQREDITALDAADFLDTTRENLPKLARLVGL